MSGIPVVCNSCGRPDTVENARAAAPEGPWVCPECGWGSASPNTSLL